jgi:hypothetical protein
MKDSHGTVFIGVHRRFPKDQSLTKKIMCKMRRIFMQGLVPIAFREFSESSE